MGEFLGKRGIAGSVRAAVVATVVLASVLVATNIAGASDSSSRRWWSPKPGTSWQWQLNGEINTGYDAQMYDIDLFEAVPTARSYTVDGFGTVELEAGMNAGIIEKLHRLGRIAICYIDTGAWEPWRPDAALYPGADSWAEGPDSVPVGVIGRDSQAGDGSWWGEGFLDIRAQSRDRFLPLTEARIALAAQIGCDGIEPDQNAPLFGTWDTSGRLTSIEDLSGWGVSARDERSWYLTIARIAHRHGLSVGQKQGAEVMDAAMVSTFDWALNEECNLTHSCRDFDAYVRAGKAVFQVEYIDDIPPMATADFCPADNHRRFDGLLMNLELDDSYREACRSYPPRPVRHGGDGGGHHPHRYRPHHGHRR